MRITPLATWARKLNLEELMTAVKGDVCFTHSNPAMTDICTAYCLAIKTSIKNAANANRATLAIQAAREFAACKQTSELVGEWINEAKTFSKNAKEIAKSGEGEFFGNEHYNVGQNMGLVKHGFVLAFYCLYRAADKPVEALYDFAMRQCVKLQGDCDTNAAIVGGLIGAYVGVKKIDAKKIKTLLECQVRPNGETRLVCNRAHFI